MANANPAVMLVWNGTSYQFVMAGGNPVIIQSTALAEGLVHDGVITQTDHQTVHVTENCIARGLQFALAETHVSDSVAVIGNSLLGGVGGRQSSTKSYLVSQGGLGEGRQQARVTLATSQIEAVRGQV